MSTTFTDAAEQLGAVLAAVEAGELSCTSLMRRRMEGARVALAELADRPRNDRMPDTSAEDEV